MSYCSRGFVLLRKTLVGGVRHQISSKQPLKYGSNSILHLHHRSFATANKDEAATRGVSSSHMEKLIESEVEKEDAEIDGDEEEEEESHLKDGLAVKMATSSFAGRRRFYKHVLVREAQGDGGEVEYEVTLDGYPLKTPRTGKSYRIPSKGLALAMALEWDQQISHKGIETAYMPITAMVTTALDELLFSRQNTIDRCLRYLTTDTVCYCFPDAEDDHKLLRRQQKTWEPLLAWMKSEFGIEIAKPEHMLGVCENTEETKEKIRILLKEMDPFTLAAFLSLVLDLKSVVTALALLFRRINVEEAFHASALEESHQKSHWGSVDLYHELDESVLYSQVSAASTFLWLLDDKDLLKYKDLKNRVKVELKKRFPDSTPN